VWFWSAEGGFGSLAGWIHYRAFDLIVGAWETTDART
jgi:hypothetical protein